MGDQNSSVTRRLAYIIVRCVFYSSARGFRHAYRATQADHPRSVFCAVITERASSVTLTLPGVIVNVIAVADRARNHHITLVLLSGSHFQLVDRPHNTPH